MRWKRYFLLAIYFAGGFAKSGELPNCNVPISFALYENGALFSSAKKSGIDQDFASELARRSQCQFEISVKPRARIWLELERGQTMMTSSGIQNSDRERFAADIRYIAIKNMVVTFSTAHVKNAADFLKNKELKLGIVRSFKYGKEADAFLEKIQSEGRIRAESDIDRVFQLLARGQVDAVLANHTAVPAYISTYHLEARAIVQDWFPADLPIPHSLMLSRKDFDEREVSKWRAIVRGMRVDGTLQKMFEHHLGPLAAKNLMQFVPNDSN